MSLSQLHLPSFSLLDTMDMRTLTGFIVYSCEYARDQDTATLFEGDIQMVDPKGSFWSQLKMFCKGLGRK
ncbi:uncharacterized protein LACBIDRAFT_307114 [Laccaria bicolor S238N-H82]|uniref:Predicted protein n=1 Tax=Laccaria bicolor (strain S238N-H82 / ATCC MYA-4686) TaxID=486041 RepID=B0DPF1_LACBS|nr:uncharacterized protein LACBIDRAFT_307114 [Laccaria bicolor S238N-H82]EDR03673.1 predicted protein [Laccaria bicolor S238N-H82]|eukprot:XP_001885821.1 predicted protein [Laccaria bicolor S238N-H82]